MVLGFMLRKMVLELGGDKNTIFGNFVVFKVLILMTVFSFPHGSCVDLKKKSSKAVMVKYISGPCSARI